MKTIMEAEDELAELWTQREELRAALKDLADELPRHLKFNVRKHFSLMVCHAQANQVLFRQLGRKP